MLGYVLLLILYTYLNYPEIRYRTIGLTKCMCAISVCALLSPYICKFDNTNMLMFFSSLFNFNNFFKYVLDIEINVEIETGKNLLYWPGINSCGCISLLILSHLMHKKINGLKIRDLIFCLSVILSAIGYVGSTFVFCLLLIISLRLLSEVRVHFSRSVKNIAMRCIVLSAVFMLIMGVVNEDVQLLYLRFLDYFDISRYQILTQGITWWETGTDIQKIFGMGDTVFELRYGILSEAHNFILETLMLFGFVGFMLMVFETFTVFKLMVFLGQKINKYKCILMSVIVSYVYYMLHPFYTSSFVIKLFLLFYNVSIYYKYRSKEVIMEDKIENTV